MILFFSNQKLLKNYFWISTVLIASFTMIPPAMGHNVDIPSVGTIIKNQDGVTLNVKDQNLFEVTQEIENISGIKITVAGHLSQETITAEVHQPDWPSAIRRLLTNYSTIEIGNDPLLKVRVLSRTDDSVIVDKGMPASNGNGDSISAVQGFVYRPAKRIQKKIWANESIPFTREQLELVVGREFNAALPKEMLDQPVYRSLLIKYGIKTEKDLGHFPKARQVRAEAGKMLRVLKKREQLNR